MLLTTTAPAILFSSSFAAVVMTLFSLSAMRTPSTMSLESLATVRVKSPTSTVMPAGMVSSPSTLAFPASVIVLPDSASAMAILREVYVMVAPSSEEIVTSQSILEASAVRLESISFPLTSTMPLMSMMASTGTVTVMPSGMMSAL